MFNKINSVVMQFLNGSLEYLGYVPSDAMVEKAVRQQKILSIYDPTSKAARSFEEIAKDFWIMNLLLWMRKEQSHMFFQIFLTESNS